VLCACPRADIAVNGEDKSESYLKAVAKPRAQPLD
jgi:hypothetical protein